MKKTLIAAVAMMLACSSSVFAGEITDIPWNQGNIETLRTLDKAAVARFVTEVTGNFSGNWPAQIEKPKNIGEFAWVDLTADGRYELLVTLDVNGRAYFNALMIYRRDSAGKVNTAEIDGWMISDLGKVIQDLNGDGKDELVIPTLFPPGAYGALVVNTVWPAVYELRIGKYVEASKEFASFYDAKVLPQLDKGIAELRAQTAAEPRYEGSLVAQTLKRDKILRVLGRDPTAGLAEAYQWMNSDNSTLLQAAAATFQDIGGHEQEKRAAAEAWKRVMARERAAHRGG